MRWGPKILSLNPFISRSIQLAAARSRSSRCHLEHPPDRCRSHHELGFRMSKPALSSRLMGLKFMQRAQEKEKKAEAEEAAEQRDAEAHWVVEGARTRCVVIEEGDPPPSVAGGGGGAGGRLSFRGFNTETEQLVADAAAAEAATAAEAEHPDGKVVSDEAMAAALRQGGRKDAGPAGNAGGQQRQRQQQQQQQQQGQQRGKQGQEGQQQHRHSKHGGGSSGGRKHRRDRDDGEERERGHGGGKKQRARYF